MKILVLTIEYPPLGGGASPLIHDLNKYYVEEGHEVVVATMGFKRLPETEVMDGVSVHRIDSMRSRKHMSQPWEHLAFIIRSKQTLKKMLRSRSFDICHTHFILPTGILAQWLRKKYNIHYIITSHGSDLPGFNPDRFNFIHHFTPPRIRSIIDQSAAIVVPSEYLGLLIRKAAPGRDEKLRRIPNGINTEIFVPGEKKKIIVSSGRLLERKGFQYLIQAVSEKDLGYTVHILGDGPMMSKLKELALASRTPIIFHGWMNNTSAAYKSLLSEAAIYCLVSTNENASISLIEALSSGCAVVTSNVSGCPETVKDAGICIDPENVILLSLSLQQLIGDTIYREGLMHKARNLAISNYHSPSIARKYIDVLKSVISG